MFCSRLLTFCESYGVPFESASDVKWNLRLRFTDLRRGGLMQELPLLMIAADLARAEDTLE